MGESSVVIDTLIRGALVPVEDGYATTDIQISAGKIAAIAPNLSGEGIEVNATNKLLLPGFLNGHTIPLRRGSGA